MKEGRLTQHPEGGELWIYLEEKIPEGRVSRLTPGWATKQLQLDPGAAMVVSHGSASGPRRGLRISDHTPRIGGLALHVPHTYT